MRIQLLFYILLCVLIPRLVQAEDSVPGLFIEGYTGLVSYAPGEKAGFHISTSAPEFSMKIERVGAKREIVWEKKSIPGKAYPIPETASSKGCGWPEVISLDIPSDWKSGYYHVTLFAQDSGGKFVQRNKRTAESSCYFILRSASPGQDTQILLQLATNTYNAYNNWGGSSVYGYHGRNYLQGNEVSFLRPPKSQFSKWEEHFVAWAEKNGYTLDFASNMDLQFRPELLDNYKLVLSLGHDEYWTWEMRDSLEGFVAKGGNAAFFSGNTCCWQIRWREETRSFVTWKQWFNLDPVYQTAEEQRLSSLWSHHLVKRPENQMTGVGFLHGGYHLSHGQYMDGKGSFVVHRPEHWMLTGTNLKRGDEFGGEDTIVGYECDGCELEWRDGLPFPTYQDGTPKSFTVLATCPAKWAPGDAYWYEKWPGPDHEGNAVLGIYTVENGGTVVTAGTTDWAHGLRTPDPAVERITKNVLDRLSK